MTGQNKHNQEKQWSALYERLLEVLRRRGVESPFGDADFWVVDDDWGGNLQKVCIFRAPFLTRELVQEVQNILQSEFPDWGVMFQLEIGGSTDLVPPEGITVYRSRIEQAWDKTKLREVLGDEFCW